MITKVRPSALALKEKEIQLWRLDHDLPSEVKQFLCKPLSDEENLKAEKFRFRKDRTAFQLTRGLLRILAGKYLNMKPTDVIFGFEKHGKPYLKHDRNLKFNVSHSGNKSVLGFALYSDIGVDIEYIKRDFDVLEIARNFFSEDEIQHLLKKDVQEQFIAFYRCWTRKEAFIKAKAIGLSYPLDSFSVSLDTDEEAELTRLKTRPEEISLWNMFSFRPTREYISAIAVKGPVDTCNVLDWKFSYESL